MAIIKSLDSSFGVPIAYHRITAININIKTKTVIICVASYLSKEARKNKRTSLEEVDIEIPKSDYHLFIVENIMETAYTWLKTNVVGFEDAEDCFESFVESSDITISEADENIDGGDLDEENIQ